LVPLPPVEKLTQLAAQVVLLKPASVLAEAHI
jgi:hypothetical protein